MTRPERFAGCLGLVACLLGVGCDGGEEPADEVSSPVADAAADTDADTTDARARDGDGTDRAEDAESDSRGDLEDGADEAADSQAADGDDTELPADTLVDTGEDPHGGIVDDVEDGDMAEYAGQMKKFQVSSDNPISGSYSIRAPDAGAGGENGRWKNGAYNTVASVSGLPNYPEPGDTFSVEIRVDAKDTYGAVLWGVQSGSHPWAGYRLRIDTGASEGIELEKIGTEGPIESHIIDREAPENVLSDREKGGFADQFDGDDYDVEPEPGVTYTCTISWKKNGKMPYVCRDPDGNVLGRDDDPKADTEFTDGGIGFMSTQSGDYVEGRGATFDDYVIDE